MSSSATNNEPEGRGTNHPHRAAFSRYIRRLKEYHSSSPLATRRLHPFVVALAVCTLALGIRLADLQGVRPASLVQAASGLGMRTYTLHAKRGDIVGSKGLVPTMSIERYDIGVNQKAITRYKRYDKDDNLIGSDVAAATEQLAPPLKMDRAELGGLLLSGGKKKSFAYVKKDVSSDLRRKANALRITGIEPEQYMKREYPNGAVAENVLGYTGQIKNKSAQIKGQAGIEKSQEATFAGKSDSLTAEVIGGGAVLPNGKCKEAAAKDSSTVKLMIDHDLQNQLMKAADDSVEVNNVEQETAIAVEIGVGRILALMDLGPPNPANPGSTVSSNWGSRAVRAPVELGSTDKLITFSGSVDQKEVTPESVFTVPYSITMPSGEKVHDNDSHDTERMMVAGILAKSYSTGPIQISDKATDVRRYDYMKKLGIGSKAGIGLPAESRGRLTQPSS